MTQDEMKKAAGWAALKYVEKGSIVGVGNQAQRLITSSMLLEP